LGESISLTIVATGFAPDQQSSITNTEAKKIIHTLEDEQKATYNFGEKTLTKVPSLIEPAPIVTEQKVTYVLDDAEDELPKMDLIPTSNIIAEIPVVYEEIALEFISDDDFFITEAPKKEVISEFKDDEISQELIFEFPLNSFTEITAEKETPKAEYHRNINEIEVFGAQEITFKRHILEDFDVKPTISKSSNIVNKKEIEEDAFGFTLKTAKQSEINQIETDSEEISPMSLTIAELTKRADDRRNKMKSFNHKFNEKYNKNVDEIEREPAFLRNGIDVGRNSSISKTEPTLKKESEDLNFKSNNTFLHDNVD
ncbi:MAG: cell division protein FtsZ, partial [Polaribacter sp.]|nr:cell division protein FtsZ [Polaribacter sp.]